MVGDDPPPPPPSSSAAVAIFYPATTTTTATAMTKNKNDGIERGCDSNNNRDSAHRPLSAVPTSAPALDASDVPILFGLPINSNLCQMRVDCMTISWHITALIKRPLLPLQCSWMILCSNNNEGHR